MVVMRWLGALLVGLSGFPSPAMPARAPSGPGPSAASQAPVAQPPGGQITETRIAAVVNDEVISVADVRSRLRMVMLSSNLTDSPETRQRIAAQVLRTIVDEKLQLQEAKRQNVSATDEEINKAYTQIEKQNNMQPGQLGPSPKGARHRAWRLDRAADRIDRVGEAGAATPVANQRGLRRGDRLRPQARQGNRQ